MPPPITISNAPENALALGTAGEHLVCADLITAGYAAFLTSQQCAYDVAVDVSGKLIRIQVRSTRAPRAPICGGRSKTHFFYRWSSRAGKTSADRARRKLLNEYDYLAFVALDIKQIAYVPSGLKTTIFTIKSSPLKTGDRSFADYPFIPR